jgi:tetratricopeptide (TPR) repeat protein
VDRGMIETAVISGQLGKAIYMDEGKCFLVEDDAAKPVECSQGDVSLFFDSGAELTELAEQGLDFDLMKSSLRRERDAHRALSLAISGFDEELSDRSRLLSIDAAEELVQDAATNKFVRNRLLAHPLPEGTDVTGAISKAESIAAGAISSIYKDLTASQEAIAQVLQVWREVATTFFKLPDEIAQAEDTLMEIGALAGMAVALTSADAKTLNSAILSLGLDPALKRVPQGMLVLNAMRNLLQERWSARNDKGAAGGRTGRSLDEPDRWETEGVEAGDPIAGLIAEFGSRRRKRKTKVMTPDEARDRAERQIKAISQCIGSGDVTRVNKFLHDLVEFHSEHSERKHLGMSLCSLAKAAIDAQRFDLAERLVGYAVELGVDDPVISTTRAQVLKERGSYAQALREFEETILRFPDNAVARAGHAEVLRALGSLDDALPEYEKTIQLFPNDVVARNGHAEVLKALGRFDDALQDYEQTIQMFPDDAVPRAGHAEVLKALGRFDEALHDYEQTIELFPNDVVARNGHADVLKALGRFDEALHDYEQTIQLFPNDVVARNGHAEVLKALGRFDEALQDYDETIRLFPNDAVARTGRAEVLKALGRFDEALQDYEQTIRLFPNDVVPRAGWAEVLKTMGRVADALGAYETGLRRFPRDRVLVRGQASVLTLLGRTHDARRLLPTADPVSRDDWIDYHVLAMSFMKTNELDEAVSRLSYGARNAPWPEVRDYFATALAVAQIRKRNFRKAAEVLADNLASLDALQRQRRLVLLGHSHAELGRTGEARQSLAAVVVADPRVVRLREALVTRYNLAQNIVRELSKQELNMLDTEIYEDEFSLALAA